VTGFRRRSFTLTSVGNMLVSVCEEINPHTNEVTRAGLGVLAGSRRSVTIKLAKVNAHTHTPIISNTLTQEELDLSRVILESYERG
jgi:hypothetical protein